MPLPEPLQKIAWEIVRYFGDRRSLPPYAVYIYEPEHEFAVRREMRDMMAYLTTRGVDVAAVSLAELFWHAVDDSGFYEEIVEAERSNPGDAWVLQQVHETLHEVLTSEPSLAQRVMAAVEDQPETCAVILYRAGALYPVFRTSALVDDLRERLRRPVVLLYPGHVVDPHGLQFMGKREPTHSYRAKIFQRSAS